MTILNIPGSQAGEREFRYLEPGQVATIIAPPSVAGLTTLASAPSTLCDVHSENEETVFWRARRQSYLGTLLRTVGTRL